MTASVIIPTHNKLPMLRRTLAALAHQSVPAGRYEVIVTDDGSTDGTGAFLRGASFPFPLKSVLPGKNTGRARARNAALRQASNDIIIFLDDDMVAVPEFIAAHLARHSTGSRTVVIGNAVTAAEGKTPFTDYLDHTGVHRLPAGAPIPFKYFASNNASVPRTVLEETGFFKESFNTYGGEDTELGFRLQRRAGCAFVYAPEAKAEHIHFRRLPDALRQMETYGETGLADIYLSDRECAAGLNLTVIEPPAPFREPAGLTVRKLAYRLLYRMPVYRAVRLYVQLPLARSMKHSAFDFLISFSYLRGLRRGLRGRLSARISA